jgi:hypothetical protein
LVGAASSHSAEETQQLFKNVNQEYHKVKQQLHVSGSATDGTPELRNSEDLYLSYDNYYQLFFPKGGSALPGFVMTEKGTTYLNRFHKIYCQCPPVMRSQEYS